jgi:hypothetical protein
MPQSLCFEISDSLMFLERKKLGFGSLIIIFHTKITFFSNKRHRTIDREQSVYSTFSDNGLQFVIHKRFY